MVANFRINIVLALIKFRRNYQTKKQADEDFLDLYNSGLYLPKAYRFIGSISIGTLHRWLKKYEQHENAECLQPNYKYTKQGEYNTILTDEMKQILLTLLLHPSRYNYGKAIKLTKVKKYQAYIRIKGYKPIMKTFDKYSSAAEWAKKIEVQMKKGSYKEIPNELEQKLQTDFKNMESLISFYKTNIAPQKYSYAEKYNVMFELLIFICFF